MPWAAISSGFLVDCGCGSEFDVEASHCYVKFFQYIQIIGNSTSIMAPRIPHAIVKELCNILEFLFFMNMLVFDPIRAMSCDILRVLQYLQIV